MSIIISCNKIAKTYESLRVLRSINLEIKKGEIIAIVGPSGAGKTTLLQILGTIVKPDNTENSSLKINSIEVIKMNESSFASFRNKNLGFIFQFHELLPDFTAIENVCIPGWIGRRKHKELKQSAEELLELDAQIYAIGGLAVGEPKNEMLKVVKSKIASMINEGKTLQEVFDAKPTKEFDNKYDISSIGYFIDRVYASLKKDD